MALTKFLTESNTKETKKKENVLLFDGHNLIYRTLHVANYHVPDDSKYLYWKYLMINSLFTSIRYFKPTKVVFAIDSKNHWRKNIYSQYKNRRKGARDKSTIDFDKFYPICDSFFEDLKKCLTNIHFIKVDSCEGDDIIAVLSKHVLNKEDITIISTDKDMIQLLTNHHIKLWDPISKKFRKSIRPERDKSIKVIMGDKSDDIPAIKKGVGIKTATKIYNDGIDSFLEENEEYKKNYERNCQLIDFDLIPVSIRKKIENEYKNYKTKPYNGNRVWMFLLKNNIKKFSEDLQMYSPFLKEIS